MTKSRKRMLLSSIAMLLVALVALGSATYAWFTINKEVTADGISVKAVVANGLVITSTNGKVWDRTASFGDSTAKDLKPVSLNPGTAIASGDVGYVATDVSVANGGAKTASNASSFGAFVSQALPSAIGDTEGTSATDYKKTDNGFFAAYRVGIKSSNGDALGKKILATVTVADGSDANDNVTSPADKFVKTALVAGDITGDVKYFTNDGGYTAVVATDGSLDSAAARTASTAQTEVLNDLGGTAQYYTLLVWYEGNDPDCVDGGQKAVANVTIKFELGGASE